MTTLINDQDIPILNWDIPLCNIYIYSLFTALVHKMTTLINDQDILILNWDIPLCNIYIFFFSVYNSNTQDDYTD